MTSLDADVRRAQEPWEVALDHMRQWQGSMHSIA